MFNLYGCTRKVFPKCALPERVDQPFLNQFQKNTCYTCYLTLSTTFGNLESEAPGASG